jgi:lipopolysaccharide assembly outer membrane protein LptD (OstA)
MERKTAHLIEFPKFSPVLCLCCVFFLGSRFVYADDTSSTAASGTVPPPAAEGTGNSAEVPGKSDVKNDEKTVITIDNAQSTTYEKDKETGDDCIILDGDVRISVSKGSTKTTISAQKIRYDRVTQMMYAEGGVSMEQTGSASGNDNATASALMFNTSTLEGVFDDGRIVQTQSDSLNLPSGSTLIVASDMFGRSESNTIAFNNGRLTFCDDPDPHWHIDASKIWLLPGGEFAFFNALFFVGVVPVMYLPAFYYPKDEVIFHPSFGYDQRSGYFVQTTTYLSGRKPLDTTTTTTTSDDSSTSTSTSSTSAESLKALFNFMKPSTLKEQRLEGIVLHNLDENYTGNTSNYFKILGDWYSNLGVMTGFDSVFKPNDYITDVEIEGKLGFSNTVFENTSTGVYLPYASSGKRYQDTSNLLGIKMPFRYEANFKLTLSKPFSLSISLPLYSDPYFTDDFDTRTETMDWISYLMESATGDTDDDTVTEVSSFTWTVSGSYTVPLSDSIKPYVTTLSGTLNSSVVFSDIVNYSSDIYGSSDSLSTYSPQRKFFYPSQITPATVTLNWSGTLFSYSSSGTASQTAAGTGPLFADEFIVPGDLKPSDDAVAEGEQAAADEQTVPDVQGKAEDDSSVPDKEADGKTDEVQDKEADGKTDEVQDKDTAPSDALPSLNASASSASSVSGIDYKLTYSIKPSYTSQIAYSSTNLDEPEDFDWSKLKSSMYTLKIPVVFDSVASYGGSFFSIDNSFTYNPVLQQHPYISTDVTNGGYTETSANSLKVTDYTATKQELISTNAISIKPFCYIDLFKNTGITYKSTVKMLTTKFIGDADNPEWEYLTTDWSSSDYITAHTLDFTFAATEGTDAANSFGQALTLTMTLPPQVDEYDGTLTFTFPYTTFTVTTGFEQKSSTDDTWVKLPFKQALAVSLFNNTLKFTESYNYDLEEDHNDALKLALSWAGLQAAYTMSYTNGYDWDDDDGWVEQDNESFLPYSLSLAYAPTTKTWYTWKNRVSIAPGISTSIVADLLRPTDSYFIFTPSLSFKINEFVTFTFSSTSKNSVLYRYVQTALGEEGRIPGEENPFVDLLDSFRFDNETLRKASGFKLKSLNFTLTHDLHDWNFKTTYKLAPRLVTTTSSSYYDFNPYVTISIIWNPMESMKTQVVDDYGTWELNP